MISKDGLELIKRFEGCRLTAYKAVPTEKYYTIGYGRYSPSITPGMTITQEQAENWLIEDLAKFEKKVDKYDSVYHWTSNERASMVSFCYNVGNIDGLTAKGTRTKKQIADAMLNYNKSGGRVLAGLTKRRQAERELFLSTNKSTIAEIAKEVISGKWGTGEERKRRLTQAGYDYEVIRAEVNRILM